MKGISAIFAPIRQNLGRTWGESIMNFLSNLSVRNKLLFSNLVFISLYVLSIGYNIFLANRSLDLAIQTKSSSLVSVQLENKLELYEAHFHENILDAALIGLAGNPNAAQEKLTEAKTSVEKFNVTIDELKKLNSHNNSELENIKKTMLTLSEHGERVISAFGTSPEEGRKAMTEFDSLSKNLFNIIEPLLGAGIEKINVDMDVIVSELKQTKESNMFASVILSIFIVILGWLVSRSIVKPLQNIITALERGASDLGSSASQVASSGQALAQGASEQAASLEETSASVQEIASSSKNNANNADKANIISNEVSNSALSGVSQMRDMSEAMNAIKSAAEETAHIVKTIDDIAFQTNLLALNAAVEAARAGDAGKGFAVVAEEVRSLAQRSASAAKDTGEKIRRSKELAENGVKVTIDVEKSLVAIKDSSVKALEIVKEISISSKEQSTGISQLNSAMSELDKVTQTNAASAEESAAAGTDLSNQSQSMNRVVSQLSTLVYGGKTQNRQVESPKQKTEKIQTWNPKATKKESSKHETKIHVNANIKRSEKQSGKTIELKAEQMIPLDDADFGGF
ncbi:MAG: methyl-accepting chemotaxis protein [bacterium]|nr:methyl-accepting chemotaxis protein [bacterium]